MSDKIEFQETKDAEALAACAEMMVTSNPWNVLYFTYEQCLEDLKKPELVTTVAFDSDGQAIGFLASIKYGIGFEPLIEYLCVREDKRSSGVGSKLVDHFENELYPDADNYYLFVSDINPGAMKLYRRLGYDQVGAIPNCNLIGQTEFFMRKFARPRQAAAAEAFQQAGG